MVNGLLCIAASHVTQMQLKVTMVLDLLQAAFTVYCIRHIFRQNFGVRYALYDGLFGVSNNLLQLHYRNKATQRFTEALQVSTKFLYITLFFGVPVYYLKNLESNVRKLLRLSPTIH